MSTVLLDTTDLGQAEELLSATFARVELASRAGADVTRTRMERSTIGSLALDETRFTYELSYRSEAPEKIALCRVYSGVVEGQQPHHRNEAVGAGQVAAFGAVDGLPIVGANHSARVVILSVDRTLFDEVAAGPVGRVHGPVRLTGQGAVSKEAGQHLVDVVDHICRKVITNRHAAASPLVASTVQRYLAAAMLSAFPNTALLEPTVEDRRDSTPVLLRRAIGFIDDNAHTDISPTDIARAVYVSPRALQYMFRKHRNCTPGEYLRQARLQYAHMDLLQANRATTTVAEVARRWGFGNVGRFAVYYRQTYGQSPHVTLRR